MDLLPARRARLRLPARDRGEERRLTALGRTQDAEFHVVGVGTSGASGAGFAGDLDGQGVCLLLGIGSVFVFGELACVVQKYLSCLREIASLLPVDRYLEERGSHVVAVRVSVEYL